MSSAPVKCEGCLTVTLVETEWVEGAGLLVRELTIRNSEVCPIVAVELFIEVLYIIISFHFWYRTQMSNVE